MKIICLLALFIIQCSHLVVATDILGGNCESKEHPDLVFVLDTSDSICQGDHEYELGVRKSCKSFVNYMKFVQEVINGLDVGEGRINVGAVKFDSEATILWKLDTYLKKSELLEACGRIKYTGGNTTATVDGLNYMRTKIFEQSGDRSNHPNYAIFITAGTACTRQEELGQEIQAIQNSNIKIFAIGVTESVNITQLIEISTPPHKKGQNYFKSLSFKKLDVVKRDILLTPDLICFSIFNPCSNKLFPDLAIVLDVSGSICEMEGCNNYDGYIKFLKDFINNLIISKTGTQVSLITFDTNAYINWNFDKCDKDWMTDQIDKIKFSGGLSFISGALELTRVGVFGSPANRPDHPDLMVIITDGLPTIHVDLLDQQIQLIHEQNIGVVVIAIGKEIDENVISKISSLPHQNGSNYFLMNNRPSFHQINKSLLRALDASCEVNEVPEEDDLYGPFCFDKDTSKCSKHPTNSCYYPKTISNCCRWCKDRKSPDPTCEYSDRSFSCPVGFNGDCSVEMKRDCCETCMQNLPKKNLKLIETTDDCVDKEKECYRRPTFDCYYPHIFKNCCKTCSTLKKDIPGCEYGDRSNMCHKDIICGEFITDKCCETCQKKLLEI